MIANYRTYGLLAEFADPERLVSAIERTRAAGYRRIDAFTPFPIEAVTDALGIQSTPIPRIMLIGGSVGAVVGYLLPYWVSVIAYPINVGGRPDNSIPSWIPIMFELAVLFAAFSGLFAWLILNRLPMPYHPLFNVPRFSAATKDRFFLCVEATDPRFDLAQTRAFLLSLRPVGGQRCSDVARCNRGGPVRSPVVALTG